MHSPTSRIVFFSLKFFKNFDYRYCLLTTWIKHCLSKVKASEQVPFSADRIVFNAFIPVYLYGKFLHNFTE